MAPTALVGVSAVAYGEVHTATQSCIRSQSLLTNRRPKVPVLPGAEPFRHEGGEVGVLLCHGFTGSPQSLRPWAEHLAERGLTVSLPLLPGHGTRWEDMQVTGWQDWYAEVDRELRALRERCAQVFVAGLSMGGALALRLAAKHGDAVARRGGRQPGEQGARPGRARPAGGPPSRAARRRASPATSPRRARTEIGLRPGAAARGALAAARSSGWSTASCRRSPSRCCCCAARRTMWCRPPTRRGSSAGSRPRT